MTQEELNKIVENHQHWINEDCDGWEDMRANLYGANLYRADLPGANLYGADLSGADLSGADLYRANLYRADLPGANLYGADLHRANLYGADLHRANLSGADLSGADLYGANLSGANLSGANLSGADLYRADLYGADLHRANLYGADLSGADLYRANLYRADLHRANLYGADLSGADLSGVKNIPLIPYACPDFGIFIGWKKASATNKEIDVIVQLEIPEDAKRLSGTGRKCRCDKAKVLSIKDKDGNEYDEAYSNYSRNFIYKVGETVTVDGFDEDRWNECSTGIHFFINRQEAVEYR